MRQLIRASMVLALCALAGNALAMGPEMRCRLSGAYIKVYGKDEKEEREVCARQGGEYTKYYPPQGGGSKSEQQGVNPMMGRQPSLRGFR